MRRARGRSSAPRAATPPTSSSLATPLAFSLASSLAISEDLVLRCHGEQRQHTKPAHHHGAQK